MQKDKQKMIGFVAPEWIHEDVEKYSIKYGISKAEFIKDCIKERLTKEELKCQRGIQENQHRDY